MSKKKVFVTRKIPKVGIDVLEKKGYQVKVNPHDRVLKKDELVKMAKGSDALLCLLTDDIDKKVLEELTPELKVVANYAVGHDNIDVDFAKEKKVKVTNTPDVLTDAVAEYSVALMLALTKRVTEADKFTRAGKYKGWEPMLFLGSELSGKTLGIVGLGRIGGQIAERVSKGFGMKVVYHDKNRNKDLENNSGIKYVSFNKLLETSDIISLHVPLLESTRHLFSKEQFEKMKNSAYLINTSRGPVVDEKALVKALKANEIKGAALDVFEKEPELSAGLKKLDNVIVTPHIASATEETRGKMSELAAKNIVFVLSGKKALTPVN